MRPTGPTNPEMIKQIAELEKAYRKTKKPIWKALAERLKKPRRNKSAVNVLKIERYANDGDVIAVPTKLLGYGAITKKVVVAVPSYSYAAKKKIVEQGGKVISFEELIAQYPDGKNIKIIE